MKEFDEYVEKFARSRGITKEEALKYKTVQAYREWLKEQKKDVVKGESV